MSAQFKISDAEREALQQLVNGASPRSLQSYMRIRLLDRGWMTTDYTFSDTGRTVARQLGIRPLLKFLDDDDLDTKKL